MPFLNVDYDFIKQCRTLWSAIVVATVVYTFNNHQHQPLSQNAKAPSFRTFSFATQSFFTHLHFIIRYSTPLDCWWVWVFLFTFLDDVVWYAAVYIYVINFIFHFSLKSGIMQILNAIFYGVWDVSAWAI